MAHTVSLICEGVFEKFPSVRFLFIERLQADVGLPFKNGLCV